MFVEEGHTKRDLEEADRIEKGGQRDLVEGTGLETPVAMGPGLYCAWDMRSAW